MGVDTIISRIKFKDTEHVLTSLNGETSDMPIFCTKTFLALKNLWKSRNWWREYGFKKSGKEGKWNWGMMLPRMTI